METDTGQTSAESALRELHAYAKLLFLRSGRQYEDRTSHRELESEIFPDETDHDGDSSKNTPLGNLDMNRLRQEFLDRLSEAVSSTKNGRHVVASHMFYWPDKAKVFVAINTGFAQGDAVFKFLGALCTTLKTIAAAPDNQTEKHTDTLWNILLRHQSPRLNAIIVDLRQYMKSFNHPLPEIPSPESTREGAPQEKGQLLLCFEDCLKLLAELLFSNSDSDLERHNSLVSLSHTLYRNFPAEHFQALGRAGDELHQAIGFLGRLRTAFHVLVAAARQISGFNELSLIPVVRLKTQRKPLRQEWSLAKTFQALNLQLSDTVIDEVMRPSGSKSRWTQSRLLRDFSRLKSPTWEVHAEIQLIFFILSHPEEVANGKRFDYIGCSKYSCLLCSKFLQFFQALRTRGCHGKLYNHSWTIPLGGNLGTSEQHLLSEVVMEVISWMRKEMITRKMPSSQKRLEAKESTIGGSLIAVPGVSQENHQQIYAASEHLHRQRAQNSYMESKKERCFYSTNSIEMSSMFAKLYAENDPISPLGTIEDEEVLEIQTRYETLAGNPIKPCASCFKVETTRQCSHCGGAPFCSKPCEREMRLSHLLACNMRQVTSADYLYEDILMDELPTDLQVRQDYWFDRCQSKSEESHLGGVFAGLVRYHPYHITREELHQWRSDPGGNPYMVAKIVQKFEELPKGNRGEYFIWFLRYRARFELQDCHDSIPRAPSPMTQVQNMQARGRKHLAPEDQHKDFADLTPFAKMHCFAFFCMAVDNLYPPPINSEHSHWFDFGFVVCHDQHEERRLGAMYNTMLFGSMPQERYAQSIGSSVMVKWMKKQDPICSFDEFWKAWERGKLTTMLNKCWRDLPIERAFMLAEYDDLLTRLCVFLEAKAPRPSIWRLRHFLAMENVCVESAASGIAVAARDYGFSEQLDTRTSMELRDFYVQLFKKAQPLAIHRERMEGKLVQFAEGHVDMTPRVKEVLHGLL